EVRRRSPHRRDAADRGPGSEDRFRPSRRCGGYSGGTGGVGDMSNGSMGSGLEIRGGAGPFEAAAVAAVVQHVLETERALRQRPRSDEHTSELQSREKLVCRILL